MERRCSRRLILHQVSAHTAKLCQFLGLIISAIDLSMLGNIALYSADHSFQPSRQANFIWAKSRVAGDWQWVELCNTSELKW